MIRPACNFNELSVAEIAHPQPLRDGTIDKPSAACAEPILEHKNTVLMPLRQTNLFRVGRYDDHSITGFTSSCEPLATFVVVLDLERDPRGRWSSLRHKYSGLMISRQADASVSTTFQPQSPASQQRPTARAVSFFDGDLNRSTQHRGVTAFFVTKAF